MKNLVLIFILISSFLNAQFLVEDNDVTENNNELGKTTTTYTLDNPVEFFRLKCSNPEYAQFSGGENDFKKEILEKLRSSIDQNAYSVNGTFDLIFQIDKTGNITSFELKPMVQNSDLLFRDLNFSFRNLKKQWKPATCNGNTIDSKIRLRVNFRTESYDM